MTFNRTAALNGLLIACVSGLASLPTRAVANAVPQSFTFEGQALQTDGVTPITGSLSIVVQIYSPSEDCLLYEESQTVSTTDGFFTIQIGSAPGSSKRGANDPALSMSAILANGTTVRAAGSTGCTAGYASTSGQGRKVRVSINGTALAPALDLGSVPYAVAAETLQGLRPNDFIRPNTSTALTQANLEGVFSTAALVAELQALINGTSSQYAKANGMGFVPTAAVSFNNQKITGLADPTAAQDAVTKAYTDTRIGGKNADATIANLVAADNGKVLSWDGTKWIATSVSTSDATKLPLAGGNMSGDIFMNGNSINNAGNITLNPSKFFRLGSYTTTAETSLTSSLGAAGKGTTWFNTDTNTIKFWNGTAALELSPVLSGLPIEAGPRGTTAGSGGEIRLRELAASGPHFVALRAPDSIPADRVWTLPSTDGTSGQVLSTDGSGSLSWVNPVPTTLNNIVSVNNTSGDISLNTMNNNRVSITGNAASATPDTGALVVSGGIGIGGSLNVRGNTRIWFPSHATSSNNVGSSQLDFIGNWWNSGTTVQETYRIFNEIGPGPNPKTMLRFHRPGGGSTGQTGFVFTGGRVGIENLMPSMMLEVGTGTSAGNEVALFNGRVTAGNSSNGMELPFVAFNAFESVGAGAGIGFRSGINANMQATISGRIETIAPSPQNGQLVFSTLFNNMPADRVWIRANGNVGIGTANPLHTLDVAGTFNATCVRANGTVVSGNCPSDARLKTDVKSFNLGLNALLGLSPKTFRYNGLGGHPASEKPELGVIAQDVEAAAPELVAKTNVRLHANDTELTEIKKVNYSAFIYVLINAVKEFYSRWLDDSQAIHAQLATIEAENAALKERLANAERERAQAKDEATAIKSWICAKDPSAVLCK